MNALVSLVVVAYHSADDLVELLPMLDDRRLEVIVLDNASPDNGRAVVAAHAWCKGVEMGYNSGWTAASNEGARRANAPTLAFVNPDVRVRAEDLLRLAEHLAEGVASVSPTFLGRDGGPQRFAFRFPDPLTGLFAFFNAGQRLDRRLGSRFARRRTYADADELPSDPDHIGAACMLVDAEMFRSSGGFDESMWLFFSDTDWALRTRRLGLRHIAVRDVCVVHEGGGSVGHLPSRTLTSAFQRDYLRYANKHYSPPGRLVTHLGVAVLVGLLPALAAVARRDLSAARACVEQARKVMR